MIGLNKIGLNQVQLNRLRLNAPFPAYGKMAGGGGSGDGFPVLPGDVTRWHFGGLTNEMMAAMDDPRIEDADGKGRFLSLKNFAWKGMSGVGGYGDENYQTFYKFTLDDYVFIASPPSVEYMNFTFRVTGLQPGNKLTLAFFGTTNTVYGTWDKDGIYTVNSAVVEVGKPVYFYNGYGATRGEFTIEILPLYPGALVFDGVDDYGTCDNFPILTKEKGYTVVALRQWITRGEGLYGLVSNVKNWFNDGAFVLEYNSNNATNKFVNRPVSFGNVNIEMDLPNNFTYQTSKSYKGVPITTGSFKGTNSLFVGKLNNIIGNCSNVAIWELVFLDHDATEEELTKIKDYFVKTYPWLFPDQAWTVTGKTNEDEDRATIANITGNGNDLVLSNFGFAEGSGYGLYADNYNNWRVLDTFVNATKNDHKIEVTQVINIAIQIRHDLPGDQDGLQVSSYKVKITGITENQTINYRSSSGISYIIDQDGIYTLPEIEIAASGWYGFQFNKVQESCNITIEQIPEYEGYLVTDGVDDKITSSTFEMGNDWTVIGDWELINTGKNDNAGIVKFNSIVIYNYNPILINIKNGRNNLIPDQNTVNAICSDGRIYSKDWKESIYNEETESTSKNLLTIGYSGNSYTKIAFKNLAIYPTVLSKEDCIKAYNYLQTLKAK